MYQETSTKVSRLLDAEGVEDKPFSRLQTTSASARQKDENLKGDTLQRQWRKVFLMSQIRLEEAKYYIRSLDSSTEKQLEMGIVVLFCYSNCLFKCLRS